MPKYVLLKPFPEGWPLPGTVFTWNPKVGKYTFTHEGTQYETPANEVENNGEWFVLQPEETPDARVIKMNVTDNVAVNYDKPGLDQLVSILTPHEKDLFISILEEVIKKIK